MVTQKQLEACLGAVDRKLRLHAEDITELTRRIEELVGRIEKLEERED